MSRWILFALAFLPACDFQKALDNCIATGACMAATPTARPISPEPGAPTGHVGGVPSQVTFSWKVDGMPADSSFTYLFEYVECDNYASLSDCRWREATRLTGSGTIVFVQPAPALRGHRVAWRVRACDASQTPPPCGPWSSPSWVKLGHPSGLQRNWFGSIDSQLVASEINPPWGAVKTYWYSGSGVGFSGSLETPTGVTLFGRSLAGAGDVNGDGFADLVVGAESRFYLVTGGTNGLPQSATITEVASGVAGLGAMLARAGDLDADGYGDVLVAERGISPTVHLYRGGPSGLTLACDFRPQTPSAGYPSSMTTLGSIGGDGKDGFAIAEPGSVHLFAGQTSYSSGWYQPWRTLPAGSVAAVAGIGDLDRDGFDDFVVTSGGNEITLYFAEQRLLYDSLYPGRTFTFTDPDTTQIAGLAAIGDTDLDGYPDFVAQLDQTHLRVYYGQAGGFRAGELLTVEAPITALAGVADADRNGAMDFAVGMASVDKVVLYRMPGPGQVLTLQVLPESTGFGYAIASAF